MSVFIPIPISELEMAREQPSRTYRIDFKRGRILPLDTCDGIDAVRQYIKKALLAPRFRCLIYDNQYGSEIKQTIVAQDVTQEYIEAEIPRIVKDALLCDRRVLDVYGFSFSFEKDRAHITFTANTIFGETAVEEVI